MQKYRLVSQIVAFVCTADRIVISKAIFWPKFMREGFAQEIRGLHKNIYWITHPEAKTFLAWTDLKNRGLLEETLVVWGGEFGRLPVAQRSKDSKSIPGRDHNPHAFTTWFAGGGVQGGVHYGETDDIGHKAAIDRAAVHDLHATILHLLGLDHTQLTFKHNGRNFRLTDVYGNVLQKILA